MRLIFLIIITSFSLAEAKPFKVTTLFSDTGAVGVANCVVEAVLNESDTKDIKYVKVPTKDAVLSTIIGARSAISKDVDLIIGGTSSQHALAIAEELKGNHIPTVYPLATHEDITKIYPYGLKILSSSKEIARRVSQVLLKKTSPKKVVIIKNVSQPWSSRYAERVGKSITNSNPKIDVKTLEVLKGFKNYSVLAKKIVNEKPDAVYIPLYGVEFSLLMQALAEHKTPLTLFGQAAILNSINQIKSISQKNPQLVVYFNTIWNNTSAGPFGKEFDKIMGEQCKQYARDYRSASVFDSIKLVQQVIKKNRNIKDQKQLYNRLKIYNFTGVLGPLKFDTQNNALRPTKFSQLSSGEIEKLSE